MSEKPTEHWSARVGPTEPSPNHTTPAQHDGRARGPSRGDSPPPPASTAHTTVSARFRHEVQVRQLARLDPALTLTPPSSSALKFNAVADWWDEYIAFVVARSFRRRLVTHPRSSYDVLKRHIYQLEKEHHRLTRASTDLEANERTALVDQPDFSSIDAVFIPLLNKELLKISLFYEEKEKELLNDLQTLEGLVAEQDVVGPATWERYMDEHPGEEDEDEDDDDDDDDDEEQIGGEHVRFESEALPKRRRRKSSSASIRPRSGSGESLNSCSTCPR